MVDDMMLNIFFLLKNLFVFFHHKRKDFHSSFSFNLKIEKIRFKNNKMV